MIHFSISKQASRSGTACFFYVCKARIHAALPQRSAKADKTKPQHTGRKIKLYEQLHKTMTKCPISSIPP